VDAARLCLSLAEVVRCTRDHEAMCGDILRLLHAELGGSISAMQLAPDPEASGVAVTRGVSLERMERYRDDAAGERADPLLAAALERLAPVHDGLLFTHEAWRSQFFYKENARRWGTEHYLVCPVLGESGAIGTIHVARGPRDRPFGFREQHLAAAGSAQLSVALMARSACRDVPRVPFRELQIARLAADGMNNLEISLRLGLARETVKKTLQRAYTRLGVRSRAQLAATLARAGLL
jgi:DNA-binding CsgD family transcriptional regulator